VLERAGLWAFGAAQLALLWSWFALHAKRLRDGGRATGLALGVAVIYLLALVLLLMVLFFFLTPEEPSGDTVPASSIVGMYMLLWLFGVFGDRPSLGLLDLYAFALLAVVSARFCWCSAALSGRGRARARR
jgi:uncharacterized membrane protein YhaH (DUF805 family)